MDPWLSAALATVSSEESTQHFLEASISSCGFVVARPSDFEHELTHSCGLMALRRLGTVQGLLESMGPEEVRREAECVVAVLPNAGAALAVALGLAGYQEAQPVAIACGSGNVLRGPGGELHGATIQAVRRLCGWARPHELLIPRPVLERTRVPEGVGVYDGPEVLEKELGFSVAILRDFRVAVPLN